MEGDQEGAIPEPGPMTGKSGANRARYPGPAVERDDLVTTAVVPACLRPLSDTTQRSKHETEQFHSRCANANRAGRRSSCRHGLRAGSARHRRRCLPLLLPARHDGHHAEAVREYRARQRVRQRPDEHVRQRPGVSARRFEGRRASQLRHALFHRVAGPHQGGAGRLRAGHGRAVLPPADARHVVGRLRVARLADDRHQGGQFPRHPARLERNGSGGVHAHSRPRPRMSGSSAAPRRTVRRITPRSTRFRRATKSRRSRVGARHPSR